MTVKKGFREPVTKSNMPTTEGHCPYCHLNVGSLEAHIKKKHKGEKFSKSGKIISI